MHSQVHAISVNGVQIEMVEIRQLEIPMVEPLSAAHGTVDRRTTILIRIVSDIGEGWGECVALHEPTYIADWSNGEYELLTQLMVPALINAGDITPIDVQRVLGAIKSHHTSKAALELAVLDAQLRSESQSLANYLGGTASHVECAIVVGLFEGDMLIRTVEHHLTRGYHHLKLKIEPGFDVKRIQLMQKHFPQLRLRVDANGSYDWENPEHRSSLLEVDKLGLSFIEQPIAPGNARLYSQLRKVMTTPIALDESITSLGGAFDALDVLGCEAFVVKPGLLGGYLTAQKLHDECLGRGVATMVGGMLETGVARAANLALASLPGFSKYPAEIAPDGRWFQGSILQQSVSMQNGTMEVPTAPGIGVEVEMTRVDRCTRRMHVIRP